MTLTLWDLIKKVVHPGGAQAPPNGHAPSQSAAPAPRIVAPRRVQCGIRKPAPRIVTPEPVLAATMDERYAAVTRLMLQTYGIKVRKWRTSMSGIAWCITYRDGSIKRLIEAPRPRGPMSAAVFLHEVGHHAIGFDVYKPRCLEEYHAWRWSLAAMQANDLNITDQVRYRMHASLWYAVQKAQRRGIKQIPPELEPFLERPHRLRRAASTRQATL